NDRILRHLCYSNLTRLLAFLSTDGIAGPCFIRCVARSVGCGQVDLMRRFRDMAYASAKPVALGLAPSFGFGDRLGLATPGHAIALLNSGTGILPIFAQQSIREMA